MKSLCVLTSVALGLGSCSRRRAEAEMRQRDSLSLWQWDRVVVLHEELDSTSGQPLARTVAIHEREQQTELSHRHDSIYQEERIVGRPPKAKQETGLALRGRAGLLLLVFVLGVFVGCRYCRPLRTVGRYARKALSKHLSR